MAEPTGTTGCPGSAALLTAWQSAPASAFQAQGIAPNLHVTGFNDISCWNGWVVASPITNANGFAVFATGGGLHLLSGSEMQQFNAAVCGTAGAPADWTGPAGPANCG